MTNRPRYFGREVDVETGYALVCSYTVEGTPKTGVLCGQFAQWHIWWQSENTENSLTCGDHLIRALSFDPYQVHSTENSACGMLGAHWRLNEPSYCTMLVSDVEPERLMVESALGERS